MAFSFGYGVWFLVLVLRDRKEILNEKGEKNCLKNCMRFGIEFDKMDNCCKMKR